MNARKKTMTTAFDETRKRYSADFNEEAIASKTIG
jgi:hypothetical protein